MDAVTRCALTAFAVMALAHFVSPVAAQTAQTREVPMFEPDPSWPKLPSKYVWGQVSSVSIDNQGHAWILQRPSTVRADCRSPLWIRTGGGVGPAIACPAAKLSAAAAAVRVISSGFMVVFLART